jgi:hypothetical protein
VAFPADFAPPGFGEVWASKESCNELVARIPLTKMMIRQNGFTLKEFSLLSSVLIHVLSLAPLLVSFNLFCFQEDPRLIWAK